MKVRSFAAHISDGAPNLLAMKVTSTQNNTPLQGTMSSPVIESSGVGKNHNYASMNDETNGKHLHLPPLLNPQSSPQTSTDATNENACCYPIFDPCFNKFSEKFKNSEKH